jgi:hypothetical protein
MEALAFLLQFQEPVAIAEAFDTSSMGTKTQTATREEGDQDVSSDAGAFSALGTHTKTEAREEDDQDRAASAAALSALGTGTKTDSREESDQDPFGAALHTLLTATQTPGWRCPAAPPATGGALQVGPPVVRSRRFSMSAL